MATAGAAGSASADGEGVFHRGSGWSIQGKRDGKSNKSNGDGEGEGDHERNLAPDFVWRTRWVCFLAFFLFMVPMFAFLPGTSSQNPPISPPQFPIVYTHPDTHPPSPTTDHPTRTPNPHPRARTHA